MDCEIHLGNEIFIASTSKTLFHIKSNALLIADCHLGKAAHFRKNSIPFPQISALPDYIAIAKVISKYKPSTVYFMGDLFHSSNNAEFDWLSAQLNEYQNIQFVLVQGNHDILSESDYSHAGLTVVESVMLTDTIKLSHHPELKNNNFNIYGHLHPGFRIQGKARQSELLPCFYLHGQSLAMPAFGNLTGLMAVNKKLENGKALCIVGNELLWLENSNNAGQKKRKN